MDLKYDNEVEQRGGEKKEKKEKIIIYIYENFKIFYLKYGFKI